MGNRDTSSRAALRERLAGLTPRQRLLFDQRIARGLPVPVTAHAVSTAQFGIWLYEQLRPGTPAYHNPAALRVHGELDLDALRLALSDVQSRHAPLRSRYVEDDDGTLRALVSAPGTQAVRLRVVDVPAGPSAGDEAARLAREEYLAPFDLADGPVWRATIIRRAVAESLLVVTLHHIVSDGSSLGILLAELSAAYHAAILSRPHGLPEPGTSFFEIVERREHGEGRAAAERAMTYWRGQLTGVPDGVALDHLATARDGGTAGRAIPFHLDEPLTRRFEQACRAGSASVFAGAAAMLAVLLSLESGQRRVPLISPLDSRGADGAGLIGCFINNVVLCVTVDPSATLRDVLAEAGRVVVDALTHHHAPFGRVVAEVAPARGNSSRPFGNVAVVHNNAPSGTGSLAGLSTTRHEIPVAAVRYDLALHVTRTDDGLRGHLEHAERFPEPTVRTLLDRLTSLVELAATGSAIPVGQLRKRLGTVP